MAKDNPGKFLFNRAVTGISSNFRAKMLSGRSAIGDAALALLKSGKEVTVSSLSVEIEQRMAVPQQNSVIKPEDFSAGLRLLEELQKG